MWGNGGEQGLGEGIEADRVMRTEKIVIEKGRKKEASQEHVGREGGKREEGRSWGSDQPSYTYPGHPHLAVAQVVMVAGDDVAVAGLLGGV